MPSLTSLRLVRRSGVNTNGLALISNCNIIPNYLFYFHRDEYAFFFEEASPDWHGSVWGEVEEAEMKAILTPEITWPKAKASGVG
jgi:hypothetical protein